MPNSNASHFAGRRCKRRDVLKSQGGDEDGEENGRSSNYSECEDSIEYPRPHRGLHDPIQMKDQWQKTTSFEVNPKTGMTPMGVIGMNPIGAMGMNPIGAMGMNPIGAMGMNPIGAMGTNTSGAMRMNPIAGMWTNPIGAMGMNTSCAMGMNPIGGMGMNPIGAMGMNTSGAMSTNPIAAMGMNTSGAMGMNPIDAMGMNTSGAMSMNSIGAMGMNTRGANNMTPMGNIGMNTRGANNMTPMGNIGMNPMSINQTKDLQNPTSPMQMQSHDNQFQRNSNQFAMLNNSISGGNNYMMMMMMKQFQQQQQMMMMSMAMNPMLGAHMGINGMNIMGSFNPYAGMVNPAMMQQHQQWLKSQNLTKPIVQKEDDSTSEDTSEENCDSDESESDSNHSSGGDKNRIELVRTESSRLSTQPPISPLTMAASSKKQRTEVVYDTMDLEFRNPNLEEEIENEMKNPICPELKQTNSPVGDDNVSIKFTETPKMDEYTKKLKDYRARVPVDKKNHAGLELGIEETAEQFDVVSMVDTFNILQGPKSNIVGSKRKVKLPEEGSSETNTTKTKGNEDDHDSDSSISSGGLSESTKKDLKIRYAARKSKTTSTKRTGNQNNKSGEEVTVGFGSDEMDIQTSEVSEVKPKKRSAKRLILEEKMANMSDYKVALFLKKKLNVLNKHLFGNAVKFLGRETSIRLSFKALKIERLGGLMIRNESRRRTPGGVFLYLVRNDPGISKKVVDELFKSEINNRKVEKRKANQTKKIKWWGKIASKVEKEPGSKNVEEENSNVVAKIDAGNSDIAAQEVKNSYDLPHSALVVPPETMTETSEAVLLKTPELPREQNIFYGDIPDEYLDLAFDPEKF